jgi:hypothetical protein
MNLPSYFLADLPQGAEMTPALVTEACQSIKRNRERYLEPRTTDSILRILDNLGSEWLSGDSSFRLEALEAGPAATGFTKAILKQGLDRFFRQLTARNLEALMRQDLGASGRLDNFFADENDGSTTRTAFARGPELLAQIAPGNIPVPILSQIVMGLLTRSAQFIKCASGQAFIPRLFAHSLYEAEPKLGACLEIAEWKGGETECDDALFHEADCVTATGSDETLAAIRAKLPSRTRFLGYGTKVSFGCVTKQALLNVKHAREIAMEAALDVAAWNQLGCLSPHVFYVEEGGGVTAEAFAEIMAEELQLLEETHPRGELSAEESAAIARRRSFYEVRAAHSPETRMWASEKSTAWTVIFETDSRFQVSCLNRFIYIKPVDELAKAIEAADPIRDKVSTIGLACGSAQINELTLKLARWGARRICPLGQMQNPPLAWRHDGRPALGDLVTWCDWEKA